MYSIANSLLNKTKLIARKPEVVLFTSYHHYITIIFQLLLAAVAIVKISANVTLKKCS